MPHISEKSPKKEILEIIDQEFVILLTESGSKVRNQVIKELLTKTERLMIAKRIGILFFLEKGYSSYKISRLLRVSPSTVERFSLARESRKYPVLKKWLFEQTKEGRLMKFLEKLAVLGLTGRSRSFKKMVDEL